MIKHDYPRLEAKLKKLLSKLHQTLSPSEMNEVQEFTDAGEYGVAFETLCGIFLEEGKAIPLDCSETFQELAHEMKIEEKWWKNIKRALPNVEPMNAQQIRVMHHIWSRGACSAQEVLDALNAEKNAQGLAYPALLTIIRGLARKKILRQTSNGHEDIFVSLIDEATYKSTIVRIIREKIFAGQVDQMLASIADDVGVEERIRKRIRSLAESRK